MSTCDIGEAGRIIRRLKIIFWTLWLRCLPWIFEAIGNVGQGCVGRNIDLQGIKVPWIPISFPSSLDYSDLLYITRMHISSKH